MPEGISVIVDDEGYANITFEDRKLRGPALDKLIKLGGAGTVDKTTENGYPTYRVPEGNAREAGLLDTPTGGPEVVQAASPRRSTPVRKQVKGTAKHRR